MTTAPARPSTPPPAARPPAQGGSAAFAPSIDPFKLIQKYLWLLIGAGVFGILIGEAGFHAWRLTYPTFTSEAVLEVEPPRRTVTEAEAEYNEQEMLNYIATRLQDFEAHSLLERVASNPRIQTEAPRWIATHEVNGTIDIFEAVEDLRDMINARPIPSTPLFAVSVSWRTPDDAAGIARLLIDIFLNQTNENARRIRNQQLEVVRGLITDLNEEIDGLTLRRLRILRDEGIDSEDAAGDDAQRDLNAAIAQLSQIRQGISAAQSTVTRMETLLQNDVAIPYDDTTRAAVEAGPLVQSLTQEIQALRTELGAMAREGIQPAHRAYKLVQARINAAETERQEVRERELRRQFETELDFARQGLRDLQAQESDTIDRRELLEARLADLTEVFKELDELDVRLERLTATRDEYRDELTELEQLQSLVGGRVERFQNPLTPDRVSSPQRVVTIALGLFGVTGLVAGLVLLRELLDQRIKGPSDVAMIPRARVLGVIPLANEDPANPKHFETIFRDQPQGVLSEHVRQFRTTLMKQLNRGDHRSLLVVSGVPRSGATGIVSNLAFAAAAVDLRVLVIDANFRRPAQHKTFGIDVEPGLAEVLVGHVTLDEAVRDGGAPNVHVLAAGSKELRVFERLGTQPMADLLEQSKESYDLVLIDTAPAIVAGDAMALATRCDAALLVVRAMAEKRGMVNRIKNEMSDSRAEFLGVLVNGVRGAAGGYMRRNIRTSHEYHNRDAAPAQDTKSRADSSKAESSGAESKDT